MSGQLPDDERRWLKRFGRRDSTADIQLLCFHHAGGNAAMYRQWPRMLPRTVEVIAIQLPGRTDRFREPAYDRMEPLLDDLIEVIKPLLERPFACYGISMGARVAWALAHTLRERAMPQPRRLFLAANAAPSTDNGTFEWEGREDGLEGYLRAMGGTPEEILAEPDVLAALLPTLRADLTVLSSHAPRHEAPLDIPIHAFAGTEDFSATADRMVGWRAETTAAFELDTVRSGHFIEGQAEQQVIAAVTRDMGWSAADTADP
ncbi:alpha/beta fold hydrolase [Streptomyces sp. NPDC093982]|uniref:thioesterase II family protein n=1 Tax=Streptomyces sp. NPDC093982 TaxID=3155077 RepID=UPI003439D757